jgi:hypothetical protein
MAFSKDATLIRTNGRSIVEIKPTQGGNFADIGYVANVMAKTTPVIRNTTYGDLSIAYDLAIEGEMAQVTSADISAALDSTAPYQVRVIGDNDTATLTNPLGVMTPEVDFNGKATSKTGFKYTYQAARVATAQAFITTTT